MHLQHTPLLWHGLRTMPLFRPQVSSSPDHLRDIEQKCSVRTAMGYRVGCQNRRAAEAPRTKEETCGRKSGVVRKPRHNWDERGVVWKPRHNRVYAHNGEFHVTPALVPCVRG